MDYDVVILGGGLAGCSVAASLAKYNLNIAVIERNFDIAEDVSQYITTFVTDGADLEDEDTFELVKNAHRSIGQLSEEANFYYHKEPSLSIFEDQAAYDRTLERIEQRGIEGTRPISRDEALKLSPHIKEQYQWMIYHENTGIISPYDQATGLGEIAFENGVRFRLEEEVIDIERVGHDEVRVTTNKSRFICRVVVITAFNDQYLSGGEYRRAARDIPLHTMLLEKNFAADIRLMMNVIHADGNASSIMPSFAGKTVVAIETPQKLDYKRVKKNVEELIGPFPSDRVDLLTENNFYDDPVILTDHLEEKGYINLEAKNHNLPAMLPILTGKIAALVASKFKAGENPDYIFKRREYLRFRDMTDTQRNEAITFDPRFGNMVCTCSNVTEGEIVNAIRRPLGARTIEGVKRRTGIIFGSCQGSYCMNPILKILAKELDKKPEEIMNDRKDSKVLTARIKEFDSV